MEYLKDDLNRAKIAHYEAEACELETIADYQRTLKMFKFKKCKERYEDRKRRVPSKYSFDIGSSQKGEG